MINLERIKTLGVEHSQTAAKKQNLGKRKQKSKVVARKKKQSQSKKKVKTRQGGSSSGKGLAAMVAASGLSSADGASTHTIATTTAQYVSGHVCWTLAMLVLVAGLAVVLMHWSRRRIGGNRERRQVVGGFTPHPLIIVRTDLTAPVELRTVENVPPLPPPEPESPPPLEPVSPPPPPPSG